MFKKIALTVLIMMLIVSPAFADWTITVSKPESEPWKNGQRMNMISISLVSDGTDLAEFSLVTAITNSGLNAPDIIKQIHGGVLYEVVTDPGVEPDGTYTLAFDCYREGSLLDIAALSATVTEHTNFAKDLGYSPVFWNDLKIDIGDIGSAADSVVIEIYIVK